MRGTDFFNAERLRHYQARRHRPDGPNETLEKPVIDELVGVVAGQDILDLGCGDGQYGVELLAAGAKSYLGIEASAAMTALAAENLAAADHAGGTGRAITALIEDWAYPVAAFDLVVSRLALHYIADLAAVFGLVYQSLRPGGRFVFSVVHPVITSSDKSRAGGGQRQDWVVDDYFVPGPRLVYFMGEKVRQYHRPVADIYGALQAAGFQVESLRESWPRRERFADAALYERRRRIPLFLFMSGVKGD